MTDIRLIMPYYRDYQRPQQPLGLYFLKAHLESKGFTAEVTDYNITGEKLGNEQYVGITVTTALYREAVKVIKRAKAKGKTVICGGVHCFSDPDSLLVAGADHVVVGDGEYALENILHGYERGETPDTIINIQVPDLNELPLPEWVPYGDPNRAVISTSRGCPWQHGGGCCFCTPHQGKHWRPMSAERVGEWLQRLDGKDVEVVDDNFTVDKKRVTELERIIRREKLGLSFTFGNGLRISTIDREMLNALKRLPTEGMAYGVESIHNEVLRASGKGQTRDLIDSTVRKTRAAGLNFHVFMIIGLPLETFDKTMQSLDWVKANKLRAYWNIATPYPKTALYDWVEGNGRWLIDPHDYTQYGGHFTKTRIPFDTPDFSGEERERAFNICRDTMPESNTLRDLAIRLKGKEAKALLRSIRHNKRLPFRRLLFGVSQTDILEGIRIGDLK